MKVRNKKENTTYVEYLETAVDQIGQAVDSITYQNHPELNQGILAKLNEATRLLTACISAGIFKP